MAAAQSAYARLLDLSMRSMSDLNLGRINKFCTALGDLRQLLACVVCCKLLVDPYQPKGHHCDHFVCRLCVRGKKRLSPKCPKCNDCSDYKIYVEDRAMTLQLLCYKTLCVQILQSGFYHQLENQKIEVTSNTNKPRIKLPSKSVQEFIVEGSQYDDIRDMFLFEPDFSTLKTLVSSLPDETPNISTATTPDLHFPQSLPEQMSISDMEIEVEAATAEHHHFGSPIPLLPTGSRVGLQRQVLVTKAKPQSLVTPDWSQLNFSSGISSVTTIEEGTYTYVLPDPSDTSYGDTDSQLLIGQLVQLDNTSDLVPDQALVQKNPKPITPAKENVVVAIPEKSEIISFKEKPNPDAANEKPMSSAAKQKPVAAKPKKSSVAVVPVKPVMTAVSKEKILPPSAASASAAAVKPVKKPPVDNKDKEKQSIAAMKKLAITSKEKSLNKAAEKPPMEKQEDKLVAFKDQLAAVVKETVTKDKPPTAVSKENQEKRLPAAAVTPVNKEEERVVVSKRKHAQLVEEEKSSSSHMRLRKQTATVVTSVEVQPPVNEESPKRQPVSVAAKSSAGKVNKSAAADPKQRKHCRCGISGPSTPKTCRNNRCWCYINGNSCTDCSCQGCNNPHKQDYIDTDDEMDDDDHDEDDDEILANLKSEIIALKEERKTVPPPPPTTTTTSHASNRSLEGLTLVALSNPEQSQHPLVLVQNENNEMQCFNIFQGDVPIDPANYGFQRVQLQNKDSGNSSIPQYAYVAIM